MAGPRSRPGRFDRSTRELTELATRLAREIATAEAAPPESRPRVLVFRVGSLTLALPLTAIREVVLPPDRLSMVPRAPAALLGIMNLRGRVVTVVDMVQALPAEVASRLLDDTRPPHEDDLKERRVLLLERGTHAIGLMVRSVDGISTVNTLTSTNAVLLDPEKVGEAIDALVT